MSSRARPKLGTQSCAPTPCRSAVSRSSRAKRRTNDSAEPSQCFQYGSVTSVVRPGSDATSFQSESPCVPSVDGQEADRVRAAVRLDVRQHLAEEVDHRGLAERLHLRRQLCGDRTAVAVGATVAAARPARGIVDADVHRHDPRGLVPEDRVDAALEHPVGPLLAEVTVGRAVEAGGGNAAPVVEHLAILGMERDPAALGLAAESAAEPPRARLDGEAGLMRDRDDLGHRVAVVGEVVLGERVEDARVARASRDRPCPAARGAGS